jgi:hypothetical protein
VTYSVPTSKFKVVQKPNKRPQPFFSHPSTSFHLAEPGIALPLIKHFFLIAAMRSARILPHQSAKTEIWKYLLR